MAIIRVSGDLGAGKTTVCKRLSKTLGYENHYTGDIFRQLALEKGLSLKVFYKQIADDPDSEREIDNRQIQLMMTRDKLVIQGRIAPFLPHNPSFQKINIFFKVSSKEGARRQLDRPEYQGKTLEEMIRISEERVQDEREHYLRLYNIKDHMDESLFDIVVDTTHLNPDQVHEQILNNVRQMI